MKTIFSSTAISVGVRAGRNKNPTNHNHKFLDHRKLDNHQPVGSFDEVMAGLRNKETNYERVQD